MSNQWFSEINSSRHFTSDNNSGVLPQILETLAQVNNGHVHAYGGDEYTEKSNQILRQHFGEDSHFFYVFNGTAANVLSVKALLNSYEAVICSKDSHLQNDECGAPEANTGGCKLFLCDTPDAKLTVDLIEQQLIRLGDQHYSQPKMVSLTQPTELGTTYSLDELKEISKFCKSKNLYLHMDGSRLVVAAAYLNCSLQNLTRDIGVDILSFGGTKNGLMGGEVVVCWNKEVAKKLKFYRKQSMQLAGKMRYISAQFTTWLSDKDIWLKNASHSHKMAKLLESKLCEIPKIQITQKVQANSVFAIIPKDWIAKVRKKFFFYVWNETTYECRLMCSFDTTEEDILKFTDLLKQFH